MEHVDGLVLVYREKDSVTARRLTESVDFFTKRDELLTGLFEGVHQLAVSDGQRVHLRLQLTHLLRRLCKLSAQYLCFHS